MSLKNSLKDEDFVARAVSKRSSRQKKESKHKKVGGSSENRRKMAGGDKLPKIGHDFADFTKEVHTNFTKLMQNLQGN